MIIIVNSIYFLIFLNKGSRKQKIERASTFIIMYINESHHRKQELQNPLKIIDKWGFENNKK